MGKKTKAMCRIVGFGALIAVWIWEHWERQLWPVYLGLIPLLLLCCGIGWLLYRKYQSEMNTLFTAEEREALDEMARSQGRKGSWTAGLCLFSASLISSFLYVSCGKSLLLASLPFGIAFLTMLFVWLPCNVRGLLREKGGRKGDGRQI